MPPQPSTQHLLPPEIQAPEVANWLKALYYLVKLAKEAKQLLPESVRLRLGTLFNRPSASVAMVGGGELGLEMGLSFVDQHWGFVGISTGTSSSPSPVLALAPKTVTRLAAFGDVFLSPGDWDVSRLVPAYTVDHVQAMLGDAFNRKNIVCAILEDAFLSYDDWSRLNRMPLTKGAKAPRFIPSATTTSGAPGTAICLSRLQTYDFLDKHVPKARQVPRLVLEKAKPDVGKLRELFNQNPGGVVVKPDTTSSGHGTSILHNPEEIPDAIAKLDKDPQPRVRVKHFVAERKLTNPLEAHVIISRAGDRQDRWDRIGPIEYKRWVTEENRIGGPLRLQYARFPFKWPGETEEEMLRVAEQIARQLDAPFLGVEFLVQGEEVFVNELAWRPDDIGMITLLSHTPTQFEMFRESALSYPSRKPRPAEGKFLCKPILRLDSWRKDDYPPRVRELVGGEGWIARFYQKAAPSETPSGRRILGYYVIEEGTVDSLLMERQLEMLCRESILDARQDPLEFPPGPA